MNWKAYQPDDRAVLCFVRSVTTKELLLIEKKRGLGAGKVNAPGGKLENGETPENAAIRETWEEVGLTPRELHDHGILRFAFTDGYLLEVSIFVANLWSGTIKETDEAVPFWVKESHIPYHRMWEDDAHWLPEILAGNTVEAEMLFDGDKMVQWDLRFSHGIRYRGDNLSPAHLPIGPKRNTNR